MKKLFCPSCGLEVEPFILQAGREEIFHCSICGLVLSDTQVKAPQTLKCILIAEDSDAVRNTIVYSLKKGKFGEEILEARNGAEFLGIITPLLQNNKPVSLVILDVEMPVMPGTQAAMGLRNLEQRFQITKKIPILFFTSRRCDERFRAFLDQVKPSAYVNKGASQNPEHLALRVQKVLTILLEEKKNQQ
jgi:CheY-like chemotaxis protein